MKRLLLVALAASGCYRDLDIGICQTNPSDPICSEDATADSTSGGDALSDGTAAEVTVDTSLADGSVDANSPDSADAGPVTDAGDASATSDASDGAPSCADAGPASEPCGKCGTRSRTCVAEGTWSAWGSCESEGVCTPGEVADVTGGTACTGVLEKKTKTCTSSCTWGADTCALPKGWTAIADSPVNFAGRINAAFAWTGGELFVCGGGVELDGSQPAKKDCALYRPAVNTWEILPLSPLPKGRTHSGAVWDGFGLMIWGGEDNGVRLADGAIYRPTTQDWSTMPAAPLAPRAGFASVWIPTTRQWFIWGGHDGTTIYADGSLFDGSSWVQLPAAPIAGRQHPLAIWNGSEVVVWGGHGGGSNAYLTDGAIYNPTSKVWRTITASAAQGRLYPAAGCTSTQCVFAGGVRADAVGDGVTLNLAAPTAFAAIPSTSLFTARMLPASWFDGRQLMIWSGAELAAGTFTFRSDGTSFDITTNSWSALPATGAPTGRLGATSVWTGAYALIWSGLGRPAGGVIEPLRTGAVFVP